MPSPSASQHPSTPSAVRIHDEQKVGMLRSTGSSTPVRDAQRWSGTQPLSSGGPSRSRINKRALPSDTPPPSEPRWSGAKASPGEVLSGSQGRRKMLPVPTPPPSVMSQHKKLRLSEAYENGVDSASWALSSTGSASRIATVDSILDRSLASSRARGSLSICAPSSSVGPEHLRNLSVVAQVDAKFIVARAGADFLLLMDQHAAGERVELERLQSQVFSGDRSAIVPVALPTGGTTVTVTTEEIRWFDRHRGHAERWGFRFEAVRGEEGSMLVTHVPDILGTRMAARDLKTIVAEAEVSSRSAVPRAVLHILAFKACRRAVKFGDVMSRAEMERLLKGLATCSFPFQCAHGRPTLYPILKLKELQEAGRRLQTCGHTKRPPPLLNILSEFGRAS